MCFAGGLGVAPPSYVFSRVSHINCDIVGQPLPVALIKNGRRERLPYKILKTTAFCCSRDRQPRLSTLNLFGWIHCGLALRRFAAHPGELLLEFLQLVIR